MRRRLADVVAVTNVVIVVVTWVVSAWLGASPVAAQIPPRTAAPAPTAPVPTAPVPATRVRAGTLVRPDTIQVGDPFVLTVWVEVPASAHVVWPTMSDSTAPVAMREAPLVRSAPVVSSTEQGTLRRETAEYQLAAWNVGALPISLPDLVVQIDGATVKVPIVDASVFVRSVLPADTSLHVPKPAKALFPRIVPWWERWWPALVLLLLLLFVAWLVRRQRRRRQMRVAFDPYARAVRDFQRLDRLSLPDAGESGRFVALALEVMRTYLSARLPATSLAQTSEELLSTAQQDSRVPTQRLEPLLEQGDAIKFGNQDIAPAQARDLASEARHIVSSVEQAEQARMAAEATARAKADKQRKRDQRDAEDEARRRSRRGKSEAA